MQAAPWAYTWKLCEKGRVKEGGPSLSCSTGNLVWGIMPQKQINIPWIKSPSSSHLNIFSSQSCIQKVFHRIVYQKSYMFMILKNTIFFTYNLSGMSAPHRWKCAGALVKLFSATELWSHHLTEIRQALWLATWGTEEWGWSSEFSAPQTLWRLCPKAHSPHSD